MKNTVQNTIKLAIQSAWEDLVDSGVIRKSADLLMYTEEFESLYNTVLSTTKIASLKRSEVASVLINARKQGRCPFRKRDRCHKKDQSAVDRILSTWRFLEDKGAIRSKLDKLAYTEEFEILYAGIQQMFSVPQIPMTRHSLWCALMGIRKSGCGRVMQTNKEGLFEDYK